MPFGFDLDPTGLLVVGDAPGSTERIQVFSTDGTRLGGFSLRPRADARVQFEGVTLNGITTLRITAHQTVLLNQPETGSLITEYRLQRSSGPNHWPAARHRPRGDAESSTSR